MREKQDLRLCRSARCSCSMQWRRGTPGGGCRYPQRAGNHSFMLVSSMLMCTKRLCAGRKDAKKLAHCQQANASNEAQMAYGNYIGHRHMSANLFFLKKNSKTWSQFEARFLGQISDTICMCGPIFGPSCWACFRPLLAKVVVKFLLLHRLCSCGRGSACFFFACQPFLARLPAAIGSQL